MIEKFQQLFDSMGSNDEVSVTLDAAEVSTILSLLKANQALLDSLKENLTAMFDKLENKLK